jgi:hypothetical protein
MPVSSIKANWVLVSCLVLFFAVIFILLNSGLAKNNGHFIYPLDDTYIHLTIARNLYLENNWGINRREFSFSSSSPLWTFLIFLLFKIFKINIYIPLILNLALSVILIYVFYSILKRYVSNSFMLFCIMSAWILSAPLCTLAISGMEHVMHALISLALIHRSIRVLSESKPLSLKSGFLILALSGILPITRYEGLFLIPVLCALFFLHGRIITASLIAVAASIPVAIFGFFSLLHGGYFLPNSVILKGSIPISDMPSLSGRINLAFLQKIHSTPHILFLLLASLLISLHYFYSKKITSPKSLINLTFIAMTLFHMQFAATGNLFRYEAYVVTLGFFSIGIAIGDIFPKLDSQSLKPSFRSNALGLLFIVVFSTVVADPFIRRVYYSLRNTPLAMNNIYIQQYQMSLFLNSYYPNDCVALNDIGTIGFYSCTKIFDLWGIGNTEVATLRLQRNYNSQAIRTLTDKDVKIAIVFDNWFREIKLPSSWIMIGQWALDENVICGGPVVSFYAVDPSEREHLSVGFKLFSTILPPNVGVTDFSS